MKPIGITQQELKEILHYDPITGIFIWKIKPSYKINAGTSTGNLGQICYKRRMYSTSNLAWYYMHGEWFRVERKDKDITNNKLENLTPVTYSQANSKKGKKFNRLLKKGVYNTANGKFQTFITKDQIEVYLGVFDTEEEAYKIYCEAGYKLYGNFFNPN